MRLFRGIAVALGLNLGVAGACFAGPVLFVVAERPGMEQHGDSFLLPLTDAADVAHARALIDLGPNAAGAPLVFAEIRAGGDGVNRDVLADGEPLWDWHVSRFEGFGDGGIELVDGWPGFIEQDVAGWIANTRRDPDAPGHIGFWSYTVVAEFDGDAAPPGVPLPPGAHAGGLMLACLVTWAQLRRRKIAPLA